MEYIPCIGNSSYSFWRILLKLYSCFQDGLKICILFSQDPEIIFFLHFNLDIFSSLYATDMYREYMPCIGNLAYSFRPILLKLYRYFAAFLWFHMRNLSLAGYNCSGGASCMACSFITIFMPRHQKVAGYNVIPSEILSVRPSVRLSVCLSVRPSVRQRPPPFLYRQLLLQF